MKFDEIILNEKIEKYLSVSSFEKFSILGFLVVTGCTPTTPLSAKRAADAGCVVEPTSFVVEERASHQRKVVHHRRQDRDWRIVGSVQGLGRKPFFESSQAGLRLSYSSEAAL